MSVVDVVIPTFNRPNQLERCLGALAVQTVSEFHVFVVDDCSTEAVEPVVDSAAASGLSVTYLRTPRNGGPAAGRNLGVLHGHAPIVLFIDDDVVAEADLIEQHIRCSKPGTAVIGPMLPPTDWLPSAWVRWEARTLEDEYQRIAEGQYEPGWRQFFTGNASVRRVDFERANGFDPEFVRAEDIEFGLRLSSNGCRFRFLSSAIGWHYASRSLASWKQIPSRYAKADFEIDRLHPEIQWLQTLASERAVRDSLGRRVRRLSSLLRLDRVTVPAAITAARMLYRAGLTSAAMAGLSFAYETLYASTLRELPSRDADSGAPQANARIGPEESSTTDSQRALYAGLRRFSDDDSRSRIPDDCPLP